jgi:hypothetical protein
MSAQLLSKSLPNVTTPHRQTVTERKEEKQTTGDSFP